MLVEAAAACLKSTSTGEESLSLVLLLDIAS
jgi:hypothetical protein